MENSEKLEKIVHLVTNEGTFDGGHHKQWVLDQILQVALGPQEYERFVKDYEELDEDGYIEYEWDRGIAP